VREVVGGGHPGLYLVLLDRESFEPDAPRRPAVRFWHNSTHRAVWLSALRRGFYLAWLRNLA
jgi:hypothetical protein